MVIKGIIIVIIVLGTCQDEMIKRREKRQTMMSVMFAQLVRW